MKVKSKDLTLPLESYPSLTLCFEGRGPIRMSSAKPNAANGSI